MVALTKRNIRAAWHRNKSAYWGNLPSCCQVGSAGGWVDNSHDNTGTVEDIASWLSVLKEYRMVLATSITSQTEYRKFLKTLGFRRVGKTIPATERKGDRIQLWQIYREDFEKKWITSAKPKRKTGTRKTSARASSR